MSSFGQNGDLNPADRKYTAIFQKLAELIAEQMFLDSSSVSPQSRLMEDLQIEDLDIIELVDAIEELFDIEIPDELLILEDEDTFRGLRTVDDFVRLIAERLD